ncbi:MAG: hypothetical protein OCC45_00535 [Desulfotalea sp.]
MKISIKILACLHLLFFSHICFAQNAEQDMTEQQNSMVEMGKCFEQIDKEEMKIFTQQSMELGMQIDKLCSQGKEKEAMAKAKAYQKKTKNMPILVQMQKCGAMMDSSAMMDDSGMEDDSDQEDNSGICD